MINEYSIRAVSGSHFGNGFVAPLCDSYSFGRIPETILGLFDGRLNPDCLPPDTLKADFKPSKKVVVLFIDALGWCFVKNHLDSHPFIRRFVVEGVVSQLTAQFPSTTAVHATTMHTGLPLAKHGIPEFRYFEPKVGDIINAFRFCLQRDTRPEKLRGKVDAASIYPDTSFYDKLNVRKIHSHVFLAPRESKSTYNKTLSRGASVIHAYDGLSAGIDALIAAVNDEEQTGYYHFYYDGIDKASHKFGPDGMETQTEIKTVLDALERLWSSGTLDKEGTTTLLIADHGQIGVDTRKSILVDLVYPEIMEHLLKGLDGKPLTPAGSPRDLFVYTKPESEKIVCKELSQRLAGSAVVCLVEDLLKQGIFGREPSLELRSRLPSIIVLPKGNNTVWMSTDVEEGKFKLGHHGGMSPEEMIIPCMIIQR